MVMCSSRVGLLLRQLGKRRISTPSGVSLQQQRQACRTLSTLPPWQTQQRRQQQQQRRLQQQRRQQRPMSDQSIESSRGYNNADNNNNHSSTAYTASGAAAKRVLYGGHSPTTPWQRAALAGWAAFSALRNPERADMVAALGEVTGGVALERMYRTMLADPEGRGILRARPVINESTVDLAKLAALPEGTFGRRYFSFMDGNNFSPDSRSPVHFVDDPDLAYVMRRYREVHDLWHVLSDLPPTVEGELALKWFELTQTGLPMCALGAVFGPLALPQREPEQQTRSPPMSARASSSWTTTDDPGSSALTTPSLGITTATPEQETSDPNSSCGNDGDDTVCPRAYEHAAGGTAGVVEGGGGTVSTSSTSSKEGSQEMLAKLYVPWALKAGRRVRRPLMCVWYEKRWEQSLDEVRKELGIEVAPRRNGRARVY